MKRLLLLSFILLFQFPTLAQKLKTKKKKVGKYPNQEVFYVLKKDKNIKHGPYILKGFSGKGIEGQYDQGQKVGVWTVRNNKEVYYKFDYDTDSLLYLAYPEGFEYDESKYDTPPILVKGVDNFIANVYLNLRYPATARENNVQGKIPVAISISSDGKVTDVKLNDTKSDKSLGKETLRVLNIIKADLEWMPAIKDGEKVASVVYFEVKYKLH